MSLVGVRDIIGTTRVSMFISFVNQVWQGNYDVEQTRMALSKTLNITAYDNKKLVGYEMPCPHNEISIVQRSQQ